MSTTIARGTAALLAVLIAALLPWGAAAQGSVRPVVVDTDLGADDVMALAWLVNEPTLDIRAILVSGTGLASCAAGVANLRALLVALDATVPEVGCGSEEAMGGATPFPSEWRAGADTLHGLDLAPAPDATDPSRPAEEILGEILDDANDPVAILSLGPPTTLGRVLADPDRAVRVASVTAMLGAVEVPGNVVADGATAPGRAEWNAHADPGAVSALLTSGVPLVLVPLDATDQVPMSQTLVDGLLAGGDDASAVLVARLLRSDPLLAQPGAIPWDALAAVVMAYPEVIEARERLLVVERDGADAGALTVDEVDGLPAQVAIEADRTAFEVALLDGVRGEGGTTAPTTTGTLTVRGGAETCELDVGGTTTAGLAIIDAESTGDVLVAVLAGLGEGHGIADLESFLAIASPTEDPPEWLLLAAYLEVEPGSTADDTVELTPGDYVAICITGEADTPHYLVAPTVLTILE